MKDIFFSRGLLRKDLAHSHKSQEKLWQVSDFLKIYFIYIPFILTQYRLEISQDTTGIQYNPVCMEENRHANVNFPATSLMQLFPEPGMGTQVRSVT